MKLTTEDGTTIAEPTERELQGALARLGLPGNGFAILATASEHYIQVAGSRADGYIVEYREGSEQSHHSSEQSTISHSQMVDLLGAYAGGRSWKSMISWREGMGASKADRPSKNRSRDEGQRNILILFFAIGVVAIAMGIYLAYATHQFLGRAVEVPGKVIKLVQQEDTYAPVVRYVDLAGVPRVFQSSISSSPPSFFEGEDVQVLYDPTDPQFPLSAKIRTFLQLWGGTLFALIFGVMFSGLSTAVWLVLRKGSRVR